MCNNQREYEIDGLKIEWGKTFSEVATLLNGFDKFKPYGGWPNIRCKCQNIFGLRSTEMEVRAPFTDRPVLQVTYQLSPIEKKFLQKIHSPFIKQLVKILGPANTRGHIERNVKNEFKSSVVVYSAKWLFGDIRISLSVYGGTRNNYSGPAAAGLFIHWIDEKKAALPFRNEIKKIEDDFERNINENIIIRTFKTQYEQRPFSVIHYELSDPYIAEKDPEWRAAQMALYNKALFQTPQSIHDRLSNDQIALCILPGQRKVYVSNKWDTIYLADQDESLITFYEILPARGPGGRELKLKDLLIKDSKSSDTLIQLFNEIEKVTGLKVAMRETYDD